MKSSTTLPSLETMIDSMLAQLTRYQSEAADADVILLATVLNPKYRLKFFDLHYPQYAWRAKELIEEHFKTLLESWPATPIDSPSQISSTPLETFDQYNVFTSSASFQTPESIRTSELEMYLQGNNPIVPGQTQLGWWRVSSCSFWTH